MKVIITDGDDMFFVELTAENMEDQAVLCRMGQLSKAKDESQVETIFEKKLIRSTITIKKNKNKMSKVENRKFR